MKEFNHNVVENWIKSHHSAIDTIYKTDNSDNITRVITSHTKSSALGMIFLLLLMMR